MTVTIKHYVKGACYGNILWRPAHPMRNGKFPSTHPIGGGINIESDQFGGGDRLQMFRERGYWASCFPEGDGITFEPLKEQTKEEVVRDVQECFGWIAAAEKGSQ